MGHPYTYFGTAARIERRGGSLIVQKANPLTDGWDDIETYDASWSHQCTEAHLHAQALAHGEPYPPPASITKAACIGRPHCPEPSQSEIESYRLALGAHDWFYEYSDDHRVYTQGRDSELKLRAMATRLDPDLIIWSEYAPS